MQKKPFKKEKILKRQTTAIKVLTIFFFLLTIAALNPRMVSAFRNPDMNYFISKYPNSPI